MKKFFVMDYSGHSTLEFKENEVEAAMAKFTALVSGGHVAGTHKAGESDYRVVRDPSQIEDETAFHLQMKGG